MKPVTNSSAPMEAAVLNNYLRNLVNLFFKILPIRESGEPTLATYIRSLQAELLGCAGLVPALRADAMFMSLVAVLQYFLDSPEADVATYRREVFKSITICNKLRERYASTGRVEI